MKTFKFEVIAFVIAAVLVFGAQALYADPNIGKCDQREGAFKEKMEAKRQELYKDLNLTAEQKKMLEENKAKNKSEMKALLNAIDVKRAAIRQELQKEALDMVTIAQLNNELKALQAQMLDRKLASTLEVRSILSPDQFKKFMAKIVDRRKVGKLQGRQTR